MSDVPDPMFKSSAYWIEWHECMCNFPKRISKPLCVCVCVFEMVIVVDDDDYTYHLHEHCILNIILVRPEYAEAYCFIVWNWSLSLFLMDKFSIFRRIAFHVHEWDHQCKRSVQTDT